MFPLKKIFSSDDSRSSLIKKNIIGTVVIKGISIPTQLLLVPLTIGYISSELYGIWLTLTSIVGWIGFFDIGFGNGLRNKLAASLAKGEDSKGKKYISTTYAYLFGIFAVVALCSYFLIPYIKWTELLNTSAEYEQQIVEVMRIVIICFCIQIVLKIQTNVWMALQLNAVASLADALGQVVTLVGVWLLTITTFPSLTLLAWVINGCSLLTTIAASFYLFVFKRPDLCPSFSVVDRRYAKDIVSLGGKFFVIQIAAIVSFQMTNIIMSNVSGPESVTEYNVIFKYISLVNMVMTMILGPMWSAFTDAYTKQDKQWMQNVYKRLKQTFCIACVLIIFMVLIYPVVFDIWLGDKVEIHTDMVIVVAIYVLSTMWAGLHSSIINGIGKLKFSLIYCNVQTVLMIPVCYYCGTMIGAKGVILAIILVTLPSMFFAPYQVVHLLRGDAKGIWNK